MLNPNYYKSLFDKYVCTTTENSRFSSLIVAMTLQNYCRQNIHFNIPNNDNIMSEIISQLYNELAFYAFEKFADFPALNIGDRIKKKGGNNKDVYKISRFHENTYTVTNEKDNSLKGTIKHDRLLERYTPITQNTQEKSIKKYEDYFRDKNAHGFLPTNFSKKILFIGKSVWDKLDNKDKVPTIYLPNTREEKDCLPKKSITALTDCIVYALPKYSVCYEQIFQKGIEVDTIVFCGTDENCIEQMLQDLKQYEFKAILLTNNHTPFQTSLPCWHWFKEEIELIKAL